MWYWNRVYWRTADESDPTEWAESKRLGHFNIIKQVSAMPVTKGRVLTSKTQFITNTGFISLGGRFRFAANNSCERFDDEGDLNVVISRGLVDITDGGEPAITNQDDVEPWDFLLRHHYPEEVLIIDWGEDEPPTAT